MDLPTRPARCCGCPQPAHNLAAGFSLVPIATLAAVERNALAPVHSSPNFSPLIIRLFHPSNSLPHPALSRLPPAAANMRVCVGRQFMRLSSGAFRSIFSETGSIGTKCTRHPLGPPPSPLFCPKQTQPRQIPALNLFTTTHHAPPTTHDRPPRNLPKPLLRSKTIPAICPSRRHLRRPPEAQTAAAPPLRLPPAAPTFSPRQIKKDTSGPFGVNPVTIHASTARSVRMRTLGLEIRDQPRGRGSQGGRSGFFGVAPRFPCWRER